eukprot:3889908-Alexandrium_andersonii.AAC.1
MQLMTDVVGGLLFGPTVVYRSTEETQGCLDPSCRVEAAVEGTPAFCGGSRLPGSLSCVGVLRSSVCWVASSPAAGW